ncbi:MAG: A24 family peptidase [Planctomycetota bacterium]
MIFARIAAGIVLGFVIRKATPWLSGVQDEKGIRIPWPEAAGGLLFWLSGDRPDALVFSTLLLAVLTADFRYKLIPDRITYPGMLIGIVTSAIWPDWIASHFRQDVLLDMIGFGGGWLLGAMGALFGFCVFEGFRRLMSRIANMEVMGMGDSKLVMMMGAFLGPFGVMLALFPGMICGLVIGVIYTRIMKSPHFPFGPALGLGGFITLLAPNIVGDGITWMQDLGRKADRGLLLLINIALLGVAVWLMLRVRKRSQEYTDAIEKDYEKLEEREKK